MSIIHDIFVNKKVETPQDIKSFNNLMYTTTMFNKYRSNINNTDTKLEENEVKELVRLEDTTITPEHKDQLFWCFYVLLNDCSSYYDNRAKSFTIEHEFKIQSIEKHVHN